MLHSRRFSLSILCSAVIIAACSASGDPFSNNNNNGNQSGLDSGPEDPNDAAPDTMPDGDEDKDTGPGFEIPPPDEVPETCDPKGDPDIDHDGDGWTKNQGDCNDCNASINPGAFDIPKDGIDNDCDGIVDNEVEECDMDLAIDDADPENAARAIDLCRFVDEGAFGKNKTWGVIKGSAKWVKADGNTGMNPIGKGLLPSFGVENVWKGDRMLALSSGAARAPGQPGYQSPSGVNHGTSSPTPEGFPQPSPFCPLVIPSKTANDPAALELRIRVPTNAKSFSFNLDFYTYEYSAYICSEFNDYYVTLMWPKPESLPSPNISFDIAGNAISVNNGLLQVCSPGTFKGKKFDCPLGTGALKDTGFEGHAATGWLVTQAPVEAGSIITLRFAIWDAGDHILDSTVLIDNFKWDAEGVEDIATKPAPPR